MEILNIQQVIIDNLLKALNRFDNNCDVSKALNISEEKLQSLIEKHRLKKYMGEWIVKPKRRVKDYANKPTCNPCFFMVRGLSQSQFKKVI